MTTIDELYELDRYELLDEFQKAFDVSISENFTRNTDLSIDTWNTADGYDVHVITSNPHNLDWEYDVYYYEPSFNVVIDRIKETVADVGEDFAIIYMHDIETYLNDYELDDYLAEHEEELIEILNNEN